MVLCRTKVHPCLSPLSNRIASRQRQLSEHSRELNYPFRLRATEHFPRYKVMLHRVTLVATSTW